MATRPIGFLGATWALVVKEDTAELFAPLAALQRRILASGALSLLVGLALSLLASRNVTRPLGAMSRAMHRVALRDFAADIPATGRGDEIGNMARTLEELRASLEAGEAQEAQNRFRGVALDNSNAAVMMAGRDMTITWVNRAMRAILETYRRDFNAVAKDFDTDQVIGSHLDMFHTPALAQRVRAILTDPSKLPFTTQIGIGEAWFSLSINYVPDDDGQPAGYIVEWVDMTNHAVKSSIIDAIEANQIMAEFSMAGDLTRTNANFCAMMGQDSGCLLGRKGDAVFRFDEKLGAERGRVFDRLNRGESVYGRFRLPRADGAMATVEGGFTPVMDAKGKALRIVLIGNDVTATRAEIEAAEASRAEMTAAQEAVVDTLRRQLGKLRDGDLTTRIDTVFDTRYEQLRLDFNQAAERLEEAMRGVVDNAELIRGEASEISSAADDLSRRTERQAATLEETASALDELTSSVRSAADGAAHANALVESARSDAEASGVVVREAVEAMGEIESSSMQISKITGVIDDIAFQTNLLALNAGVEAARAGEAGRGFAVVASEVRALAQRSSEAAREINGLIAASGGQVKRGVDLVGQAGKALVGIVEGVKEISRNVAEIAASSQEQSAGLAEINAAMNQLDQVTQRNAAMFEQTTAASHALTREAEALTATTGRFRTGSAASTSADVATPGFASRRDRSGPDAAAAHPAATRIHTSAAPAPVLAASEDDWDEF
ncbi:MAG: PAS domain-containing protein [Maritimibacter sp.]|nr:PAS domain-containing protein [Maritimibacter sp.]